MATPSGATAGSKNLPPHPDAAPPAPVPVAQPTGPVGFVPGPPAAGAPPFPPPGSPAPGPTPTVAGPSPADPAAAGSGGATAPSWPDTLESDVAAPAGPPQGSVTGGGLGRTALVGAGLAALGVLLVLLGVSLDFGAGSFWSVIPLWSAFATACALVALAAFAASVTDRLRKGAAERVIAGGLAGLAVFWLLVVLPDVGTDRGFVLTAALACLGGALWLAPRARD